MRSNRSRTRRVVAVALAVFGALVGLGAEAQAQAHGPWTAGTARTLPAGGTSVGVFQPVRVGVHDKVEVSSHLLFALIEPNLDVKFQWAATEELQVATIHSLVYPTALLRQLACRDNFCAFPATSEIPPMVGLENGVLGTAAFGDVAVTLKLTSRVGMRGGELRLPSIDLPLAFTRLAQYQDDVVTFVAGVDVDGPIWGPLFFTLDADLWQMFGQPERTAVEHSTTLRWDATEHVSVFGGYKFIWGEYPFGNAWHVLPMLDVAWTY